MKQHISKYTVNNILSSIQESNVLSGIIRAVQNNILLLDKITGETSYFTLDISLIKRLYHIKHNYNSLQICLICNTNEKNWYQNKYANTCKNQKCITEYKRLHLNPEKRINSIEKRKLTRSKFTQEQRDASTLKRKQTNLLKYGKESYAQTDIFKSNMLDKFGYVSPFELKETHDKKKQTLIDRTGYDHNFKIPEIKEKRKQTFIKNYGFDNACKNDIIKQKIVDTNQEKYGSNCPLQNSEIKQKSVDTLFENFGVDSPLQNKDLLAKFRKTMLNTYGYEHWLQNDINKQTLFMKSFKYKEYTLNNKTVYLQGYEDYVLFEILLKQYTGNDIYVNTSDITEQTDQIFYIGTDGNRHKYYPDFYIKSVNKIIEVKSIYTYNKDLETNLLKEQTCKKSGLDFEFVIVDKKIYKEWQKNKQKD